MVDESRHVLPDILMSGLDVVIVGAVVPENSAGAGHYYANPQNSFWKRLHKAGLTPRVLTCQEDRTLPEYGIGLTDMDKTSRSNNNSGLHYTVEEFLGKMAEVSPRWIVFNGKDPVDDCYARFAKVRRQGFGLQAWSIGSSRVFVAPNTSPRVRDDTPITGPNGVMRPALDYWLDLGDLVRESRQQ